MATTKDKRGPTREQLTEGEWENVCRLFETLERIGKRIALSKRQVANG